MQTWRTYNCADCGIPVRRKRRDDQPLVCLSCGIRRAQIAARQMRDKKGPAWDRFQASAGPRGRPRIGE